MLLCDEGQSYIIQYIIISVFAEKSNSDYIGAQIIQFVFFFLKQKQLSPQDRQQVSNAQANCTVSK